MKLNVFGFVKIWLAYPLLLVILCLIFSVCDDCVLTREHMMLQMDLWEII